MASLTWCTWVWVSYRSWWWTGKPGMLQSMGSKESYTTEWLNWIELKINILKFCYCSVAKLCSRLPLHGLQHARLLFPPLSCSLLKSISSESKHPILCWTLLSPSIFPSIGTFSNKLTLPIRWPKYWALASASVFPMNIQVWFPLGLIDLISLQSKGLSRVFSNTKLESITFSVFSLLYGQL